jgi:acetyl esterase/lipase
MTILEQGEIARWVRKARRVASSASAAFLIAASSAAGITTYTYKRVDGLEIKADVHDGAAGKGLRPVVVWLHGGALINGGRQRDPSSLIDCLLAAGCCVVSIDYRLAPESKLPAIVADVEDAFRWVREKGPALFRADPKRIGVVGTSAGGYLALVSGYRVHPRPQAIVSHWGYGDLVGAWYTEPSRHARHLEYKLSEEEAWKGMSGPPIANPEDRKDRNGRAFYQYCRQHGLWPKAVSDWDPRTETARFVPYLPVRNVSPEFPPTLLVHGTDDTDVPHEQSELMAREFTRHKVKHLLLSYPGGEHGLKNLDPSILENANRASAEFLLERLR